MDFKDHYATLGVGKTATPAEIKHAYRKLARKFHPDVSKEADAEARFKDVAEAYAALKDTERRTAYDELARRHAAGQSFDRQHGRPGGFGRGGRGPDGASGHPQSGDVDLDDLFESLFRRDGAAGTRHRNDGNRTMAGTDLHAQALIDLADAYRGARRVVALRVPAVDDAGRVVFHERQLEVGIPKGVREGQKLRLAGQGGPGHGDGPAGDLYLEIRYLPHPVFRPDGSDLYLDLPVSPWEAALGATVTAPTLGGTVQLKVPANSAQGRKLRLKGLGLPGSHPGDLYAVLSIALPASDTEPHREAYHSLARAFPAYNPREALEV